MNGIKHFNFLGSRIFADGGPGNDIGRHFQRKAMVDLEKLVKIRNLTLSTKKNSQEVGYCIRKCQCHSTFLNYWELLKLNFRWTSKYTDEILKWKMFYLLKHLHFCPFSPEIYRALPGSTASLENWIFILLELVSTYMSCPSPGCYWTVKGEEANWWAHLCPVILSRRTWIGEYTLLGSGWSADTATLPWMGSWQCVSKVK